MDIKDKRYNIIYTDPPWNRRKGGIRNVRPNQTRSLDYDVLSLEEIFLLQRKVRDNNTTEDHAVFLWAIDKYLPEIEANMKALGYRLHARIIWNKLNGVAPAFTIRYSHEYLLWFYQGKMMPIETSQRGKWTTVLTERSTKHSAKPVVAYEFIESIYPGSSRLEMYARTRREGWDAWGDQVPDCCFKPPACPWCGGNVWDDIPTGMKCPSCGLEVPIEPYQEMVAKANGIAVSGLCQTCLSKWLSLSKMKVFCPNCGDPYSLYQAGQSPSGLS